MSYQTFRSVGEHTAALILDYWYLNNDHKTKRWTKICKDYACKVQGNCSRVVVRFHIDDTRYANVVLFLVNPQYQQRAEEWLEEISSWDQALFYDKIWKNESEVQYHERQQYRLMKKPMYPTQVSVNSFELRWKLVGARIEFRSTTGYLVEAYDYPIGELREGFSKKHWSGIIPVSGDDFTSLHEQALESGLL